MSDPSPFTAAPLAEGARIYGRHRDIDGVYNLICSSRIVVLHAASGAGKTSLVQAGLIPRLATRFSVWGPMFVGKQPNPDSTANRFSASVIRSLEPDADLATQQLLLAEYAKARLHPGFPVLFLFDQFEDLLTVDPLNRQAIADFCDQLRVLLEEPSFFALFVIRDDSLSSLDRYRDRIPTQLRNRYHLDFLSLDAATEVLASTAADAGRPFTESALNRLVNDLAAVPTQNLDGTEQIITGETIEPFHLQLACMEIWESLPPDRPKIGLMDLQQAGDVSIALSHYFDWSIERIVEGNPTAQADLRDWIAKYLISPTGLRAQLRLTPNQTAGLANSTIDALIDDLLIRRIHRSGAIWLELAHDRLAHAIEISNQDFDAQLPPFERAVREWLRNDRNASFLMPGDAFAKATLGLDLAKLDPPSKDFFDACVDREQDTQRRQQAQRLQDRYTAAVTIAAGAITAVALWSILYVLLDQTSKQLFLAGLAAAAILGATAAWAGHRFYLHQSETNRILHALTRKHRDDLSLQSGDYAVTATATSESNLLDIWDNATLDFVPYWILLAVAGADGRFTAREFKALPDRKLIDEFLADPRPAADGLLDAATILNTKMQPAEATAFRDRMNQLAATINRDTADLRDSLQFVKVALEGGDIAKLRPNIARFYQPSGLFPWPQFLAAVITATLLSAGLGGLSARLHWPMAIVSGCLTAFAILLLASQAKLRSRPATIAISATAALAFYLTDPHWLDLLLFALPSLFLLTISSSDVFCERCNDWTEPNPDFLTLSTPEDVGKLIEDLQQGNYATLTPHIVPAQYKATAKDYLSVEINTCPTCQDFHTLSLTQTTNGATTDLLEHLLLNSSQLFLLKSQQPGDIKS